MNGFTLKLIAIITMLIDHATELLVPQDTIYYTIGRSIGRLAFPIFCFLLVEGLFHTSNIKKYLVRLGAFAIISEVPFDLAFFDSYFYTEYQNVFFTLFIGLAAIYIMNYLDTTPLRFSIEQITILKIVTIVIALGASYYLKTDYSIIGVIQILFFYLFRNKKDILPILIILLNMNDGGLQSYAGLAMLLIWFYNGKRGPKFNKYVFYAFYPVHLLILNLIYYNLY